MSRTQDLLNAVLAWLETFTDLQDAQIGVPKAFAAQVTGYVVLGGTRITDEGGIFVELQDVIVGFGYDIDVAAANDAELSVAGFRDEFIQEYHGNRRAQSGPFNPASNGGWTIQAVPDGTRNSTPQYLDWSRSEVRHWVYLITYKYESS